MKRAYDLGARKRDRWKAANAWASGVSLAATWCVRLSRISLGEWPATSPSRMSRPFDAEDVSQHAAELQAVVVEVLCTRLRARLRSPTNMRR